MTRREAMRQTMMFDNLRRIGFTQDEAAQLLRISLTLHHWAERCCNEDIETCDDGSAWVTPHYGVGSGKPYRIQNREVGAFRRLAAILKPHTRRLTYYYQTDPRGAALYIIPLAKLREYAKRPGYPVCTIDCCYSSVGLAVY